MQHKRKNIRLQGYDYSQEGLYFLTIVVQNRLHLFGHVENQKMILNDAGRMIEQWYREIEHKYPDKRCREMVVMPNHFHCIIENVEMPTDNHVHSTDDNVSSMDGDDLYRDAHVQRTVDDVQSTNDHISYRDAHVSYRDAHVGAPLRGRPLVVRGRPETEPRPETISRSEPDEKYGIHNKKYGASIGDVMDWFKTMTTNEYIRGVKNNYWERFDGKLWQRNYYDRIIRDWEEDVRISTYILENPEKWNNDKFNSTEQ